MNLVDSCGWLEYFADGPNADFFTPPILDRDNLLVPSICILEVFKRVLQQRGENDALRAIATMQEGDVVDLDSLIAVNAAKVGFELGLPLADSVILATARAHQATVWTQDSHFETLSEAKYKAKH